MNWGTKIAIVYTFFATCLIGCVIASTFYDFQLVRPDYFDSEKEYNGIQKAVNRAKALPHPVEMKVERGQTNRLVFCLPEKVSNSLAKAHFYRPSDASLDQVVEVNKTSDGLYSVNTDSFASGFWRIRLIWEIEGEKYISDYSTLLAVQ